MAVPNLLPALVVLLSITCYECYPRGRILGGSPSVVSSRPYLVSLQVDGIHMCGGLLISDEWVLSAAHCKPDSVNKTLQAVLGTNSLTDPKKLVYVIDIQIMHPLYNKTTKQHDLLLLKLPQKVPLSKSVSPLPYQMEDILIQPNTLCLVAGWGKIRRTGRKTDVLNEAMVPVISPEICNRRDYYHGEITANMMCAGDNRRDSCEGDSGGPLICNGVAEAIVSSGSSVCGNLKRPGVYTRIYPYNVWIVDTMRNNTELTTPIPTAKSN
ncbi:serine protease ami-like [Bufo gargarizans]|uniref:serine protease ami-like n=1 Tax=Bufo gargarizans TaxID=30331 RepID=UPI001CF492CC|nr:serine protease ami-like [Bufo gargarizans]